MVIVVQLAILLSVMFFRWRQFLGSGLKPAASSKFPNAVEQITEGKGNSVYSRWVGLEQAARFPFVVRRERWYHGFLKAIGVAQEISVSNHAMDRKLFFITDYPSHLEESLKSKALQDALASLFEMPVKSLFVSRHKSWCVMASAGLKRDELFYDLIRTNVKNITSTLTEGAEISSTRFGLNTGYWAFLAMALHMGLFLTAILGALPTFFDSMEIVSYAEWWSTAIFAGLILAGIWLGLLIWFFHGTSWAGWVLTDFLLAGLVGIMMSTGYGLREVNILFDIASPTMHVKPVVYRSCSLTCSRGSGKRRKSSTHSLTEIQCEAGARSGTLATYQTYDYKCSSSHYFSYYLAVEPWRKGESKPYDFTTNSELFDDVRRGTPMSIPSHPGYFGIEWVDIDSIQPAR